MDIIYDYLDSSHARNILPAILTDDVLAGLDRNRDRKACLVKQGVTHLADRIKKKLLKGFEGHIERLMDPCTLAFRAYIISRMIEIFNEDALSLKKYHD